MTASIRAFAGALLLALLAGCATTNMGTPGDPLERMNRATHRFNDAVDKAVLKPVATGYRNHVPQLIRTGVNNFLDNLAYTTTIVNDFLQLKLKDTLIDLGRFAVNTTLGVGGILDPATHFGIPRNDEDFGQTLGRWGVPPGPYVVLPFLGPSTMRDAPALYADVKTDLRVGAHLDSTTEWSLIGLSFVNRRAELLPFDASVDSAYDRYAFVRDAWLQRRQYQVKDGQVPDDIPADVLEDPEAGAPGASPTVDGGAEPAEPAPGPPSGTPAAAEATAPPTADPPPAPESVQPPATGESSSETSLIPASEESAGGTFR